MNESFRSPIVPDRIQQTQETDVPVRHLFSLDCAFPVNEPGRTYVARMANQCRVTLINNHELPANLLEPEACATAEAVNGRNLNPAALGILHISPQTLKSIVPASQFPTAMILKEIASLLIHDEQVLNQIAWQAAVWMRPLKHPVNGGYFIAGSMRTVPWRRPGPCG